MSGQQLPSRGGATTPGVPHRPSPAPLQPPWAPPPPSLRTQRLRRYYRHMALWTLQGWLAMFYFAAGYAKLTEPADRLAILLPWTAHAPLPWIRSLGVAEAGLALLVLSPLISWTWGHRPLLAGTGGLFSLASAFFAFHLTQAQPLAATVNLCLMAIAAGVALGRRKAPNLGDV